MFIEYDMTISIMDEVGGEEWEDVSTHATAILRPASDGKYMISSIIPGSYENKDAVPQWMFAYSGMVHSEVLALQDAVIAKYTDVSVYINDCSCALLDMDGDSIPELIYQITTEDEENGVTYADYYVYACSGDQVRQVGSFNNVLFASVGGMRGWLAAADNPGHLLNITLMAMSGYTTVEDISLQNGALVTSTRYDGEYQEGIPENTYGPDLVWWSPFGSVGLVYLADYE